MRNIRLLIQYDGSAYNGWQFQPNGVTIQEKIEKSIELVTGIKTQVVGAGRTDAGVHALGQCACFMTNSNLSSDKFREALNAILPPDIRILKVEDVDKSLHARFSAISKTYVYIVYEGRTLSPFLQRYVWRLPYSLDIKAMQNAADRLVGSHDFSSFRGSGCGAKTAFRTLKKAEIDKKNWIEFISFKIEGSFIVFRFEGDSFLRHMVRNMVGTLVEVGRGKIKPEDISNILEKKDRNLAGPTAPAHGLFLEKVDYK